MLIPDPTDVNPLFLARISPKHSFQSIIDNEFPPEAQTAFTLKKLDQIISQNLTRDPNYYRSQLPT